MRASSRCPLRASLAFGFALVLALAQAGGAAWVACGGDGATPRSESCCCDGSAPGASCCDGAAAPRDRLVNGCGCDHTRVPGATLASREPTLAPAAAASLPAPDARLDPLPATAAPRGSLRPVPEPPPPRARA